jgi:hypothetical protein
VDLGAISGGRSFSGITPGLIIACDFCVVVTAGFRILYVFVVMEHASRRLIQVLKTKWGHRAPSSSERATGAARTTRIIYQISDRHQFQIPGLRTFDGAK